MSKEYLEALDWLEEKCYVESPQAEKFEECCKIIRQSLHRLEAIDNANPSEALRCLEKLELLTCDFEWYKDNINTIKQALLKAEKEHNSVNLLMQELDCKDFAELRKYARCGYEKLNKKYLKWEDLEFEDFPKEIEVRIGDNICKLEYKVSMLGNKTVILMGNNKIHLQLFENEKQFFNDLHLEVEENNNEE